jgi:hypothetical protein
MPNSIGDVGLDQAKLGMRAQTLQPVELEPNVVVGVEIVQADDVLAALEQPQTDRHADKSGCAGEQYFHRSTDGCERPAA